MSSSLEIADISKNLDAMRNIASKLININNLINNSIKKIEKRVDDIEKQSSQHLKKIAEKFNNINNSISIKNRVEVDNKINIENIIDNDISINIDGCKDKPPSEGNRSYSIFDDFIVKIKSLIENFSLFTLNFNPNVSINANAGFYMDIKASVSLIANLVAVINIKMLSIFASINILADRLNFFITLFALQTAIVIGQLSSMMGLLLARQDCESGGSSSDNGNKSWWRIVIDFLSDFNTIIDFFDNVFGDGKKLESVKKGIKRIFSVLSGAIRILGIIIRFAIGVIFKALGLLFTPAGLVIAAIIAVCALLYIFRDEIKAVISAFIDYTVNLFKAIWSYIVEFFNSVKTSIMNGWSTAVNFISNSIDSIIAFFSGLWDSITQGINMAILVFGLLWDSLTEGIRNGLNDAIAFFANLWDAISHSVSSIKDNIVGFFKGLWTSIVNSIRGMLPDWVADSLFGERAVVTNEELNKTFNNINEQAIKLIENNQPGSLDAALNVSPHAVASVAENHYAVSQSANITINVKEANKEGIKQICDVVSNPYYDERRFTQTINGGAS